MKSPDEVSLADLALCVEAFDQFIECEWSSCVQHATWLHPLSTLPWAV